MTPARPVLLPARATCFLVASAVVVAGVVGTQLWPSAASAAPTRPDPDRSADASAVPDLDDPSRQGCSGPDRRRRHGEHPGGHRPAADPVHEERHRGGCATAPDAHDVPGRGPADGRRQGPAGRERCGLRVRLPLHLRRRSDALQDRRGPDGHGRRALPPGRRERRRGRSPRHGRRRARRAARRLHRPAGASGRHRRPREGPSLPERGRKPRHHRPQLAPLPDGWSAGRGGRLRRRPDGHLSERRGVHRRPDDRGGRASGPS